MTNCVDGGNIRQYQARLEILLEYRGNQILQFKIYTVDILEKMWGIIFTFCLVRLLLAIFRSW